MLLSLRYFHQVARLGSIRQAADALNVSPSSVSRRVLILERQFGTALLHRSGTGISLTESGRLVDDFGRNVLLDYDTLRSEIDDLRGTGRTTVRVAVVESMISGAPMTAIETMGAQFPRVHFRLIVSPAADVAEAVRSGSCDIGLTLDLYPHPDLHTLCSFDEPVMLAVRPDHPLAAKPGVSIRDLESVPLAVHEEQHGVRRLVDRAARENGYSLVPVLSSSSLEALRSFAARGLGAAIVTRSGAAEAVRSGALVLVPIEDSTLSSGKIVLLVRRNRRLPRAISAFADSLKKAL